MIKLKPAIILQFALLFFLTIKLSAQEPPFMKYIDHPWVDSTINTLDTKERIAQSIWMAAWSNMDVSHSYTISELITKDKIGGLIFFQGTAAKEAELINHYQSLTNVPLLMAMDAEWGPGMRLDNILDMPFQMTLGAIRNDSMLYFMGLEIARQMKVLGLNLNLAPVADINNNPNNPVINYRSFGENKIKVTNKTLMYSSGLQDGGIAATAKHFPGHGDTDTDSHHALPQINHSKTRFDTLELIPFKSLIDDGISSVMSAHLNIPAYDPEENLPSTLSKNIIKGLLKDTLGFNGLVITDAMNMRGLTDYYDAGVADALAYAAGNDVLEYVEDAGLAINSILSDLEKGLITTDEIEEKCRKILALKYWCGLSDFKKIDTKDIDRQVNIASAYAMVQDLYTNALTVLNNQQNVIPLRRLESRKIATLSINGSKDSPFNKMVNNYVQADKYSWKSGTDFSALISSLENYDIVLTIVLGTDQRPYRDFGVTEDLVELLNQLSEKTRLVGVYSGNPYAIDKLPGLQDADGLIISYQENKFTQELAAQLIFGGIGGHGKLPVTINSSYPEGYGIITPGKLRLQYGYPENGGVSSALLNKKIDSIVRAGLDVNAFPGCEVIAARKGVVIFHKAYGYHTFLKRTELKEGDIFDLASLTKVSAATVGLMKLDDMGLFDPDKNLGIYFPFFKGSDKAGIRLRDILAHQAGLQAGIPYWKNTVKKDGSFKCSTFRTEESKKFNIRVSDKLF